MHRTSVIIGTVCVVLAVTIFVLAEGARRIYSGGFFLILGLALLMGTLRGGGNEQEKD